MELILVRHGIAYERDDERWPDDRDRPLTLEGEKRFRRAAKGLGRIAETVDVVLSSPLIRAWRTAQLLAEEAGWPEPLAFDALEPERSAADLAAALKEYGSRSRVAAVGHEPLLGDLVAYVLAGSDDLDAFPLKKGGAACVSMDELEGDVLRWFVTPKIERALGS